MTSDLLNGEGIKGPGNPMWREAKIDLNKPPKKQPTAISIGHNQFGPTVFGSYGDFSCIYGPPKNKKTFLKSAIVSGYIGGQSTNYFPNIKGWNTEKKYVIDIDCEQGTYHAHRVMHRVKEMVGFDSHHYYWPLSWRQYSPQERMEGLEDIFNRKDMQGKIGLVCIDGFADLVNDVNDLRAVNELTSKLLKWTKESNCHITGVLHSNYGSKKPTGHLGSAILKKAETIAYVSHQNVGTNEAPEIDKSIAMVECIDGRNIDFDTFVFSIKDGLPTTMEELDIF